METKKPIATPSPVSGEVEEKIKKQVDLIFDKCTISLSGPDNGQLILSVPRAKQMFYDLIASLPKSNLSTTPADLEQRAKELYPVKLNVSGNDINKREREAFKAGYLAKENNLK